MDAQGTGLALLQLNVEYNVEYPWQIRQSPYVAFNMTVNTKLYGRNFSHIDYTICLNWLNQNSELLNSNQSGLAQFEMKIPTGYRVEERFLKTLIGVVRNLGDAKNEDGPQVSFLFDFLDFDPICFNITLHRYIPVANLSRYYEARVFEYLEPGNGLRSMYNLRDIFSLDICEVCGSYQCPYCPYYAHATINLKLNLIYYLSLIIFYSYLSIFIHKII